MSRLVASRNVRSRGRCCRCHLYVSTINDYKHYSVRNTTFGIGNFSVFTVNVIEIKRNSIENVKMTTIKKSFNSSLISYCIYKKRKKGGKKEENILHVRVSTRRLSEVNVKNINSNSDLQRKCDILIVPSSNTSLVVVSPSHTALKPGSETLKRLRGPVKPTRRL